MEMNVFIVDDHQLIIDGYKSILSYNNSGFRIVTNSALNCKSAYDLIIKPINNVTYDIFLIDITIPSYPEMKINNGVDLAQLIRKIYPKTKIIIITSHSEVNIILKVIEKCNPEGFLLKNDVSSEEFLSAFTAILNGQIYYSETVKKYQKEYDKKNKLIDNYNIQIITLLSQGIKNKNIHERLHLSKSAVDKRKVIIKELLNIENGNDEDIIREAKTRGII